MRSMTGRPFVCKNSSEPRGGCRARVSAVPAVPPLLVSFHPQGVGGSRVAERADPTAVVPTGRFLMTLFVLARVAFEGVARAWSGWRRGPDRGQSGANRGENRPATGGITARQTAFEPTATNGCACGKPGKACQASDKGGLMSIATIEGRPSTATNGKAPLPMLREGTRVPRRGGVRGAGGAGARSFRGA